MRIYRDDVRYRRVVYVEFLILTSRFLLYHHETNSVDIWQQSDEYLPTFHLRQPTTTTKKYKIDTPKQTDESIIVLQHREIDFVRR